MGVGLKCLENGSQDELLEHAHDDVACAFFGVEHVDGVIEVNLFDFLYVLFLVLGQYGV